jgi:hypothetical protein
MKFKISALAFGIFFMFALSSCLHVEKKQYTFELTGENSGKLTVKYINLFSNKESDTLDISEKDYESLVNEYLEGGKLEEDYPGARNFKKRIFEENGVLCGEVTMEFENLDVVKLFKYDKASPMMYYYKGANDEKYLETNGKTTNSMPVVFWDKTMKKLTLTTKLDEVSASSVSLVEQYRKKKK